MAIREQTQLERVRDRLREQVAETVGDLDRLADQPTLVRIEVPASEIDLLPWLAAQDSAFKVFWSDRSGAFAVAGVGSAYTYTGSESVGKAAVLSGIHNLLQGQSGRLRCFGGFSFNAEGVSSPEWAPFGNYRFDIPLLEAGHDAEHYYLACNIYKPNVELSETYADTVLGYLDNLVFEDAPARHEPELQGREDVPTHDAWTASIRGAVNRFAPEGLKKVVLARRADYQFDAPVDPIHLLTRLQRSTSFSYHYGFQLGGEMGFIGASPERLFHRNQDKLESEALAGTRPRGATSAEDDALGRELLHSDKDLREHGFVVDRIAAQFREQCSSCHHTAHPELLKLRRIQHLLTRITGDLNAGADDGDLIDALHPTPAVGGVPTDTALQVIQAEEPFDRGWYAAPVGWVSAEAAEFAVAIRSALVHGDSVSVYSGAGIVPGSNPESEWSEIENKIADFDNLFQQS